MYVCPHGLVDDSRRVQDGLPAGWTSVELELEVGEDDGDRAAALLGPAQPFRAAPGELCFHAARTGDGPSAGAVERLLARLDSAGIAGTLGALSAEEAQAAAAAPPQATLAESWAAELAQLPSDWSDVYGEIDLISSDYFEAAALQLVPINPRRVGPGTTFHFRCAARFGYGASPGMVARCVERCDEMGIRGTVRVLRALSDTRPVGTQGPVWYLGGRTVYVRDDARRHRARRGGPAARGRAGRARRRGVARLERVEPRLNAFVTTCRDEALAAARGPLPDGPFRGVPIAIKDLNDTRGLRTTYSCRAFADHVPDHDDAVVRRLRTAGFVVIGKSNTPEFGSTAVTESALNGACRNPSDPSRTPGGSSGGAAAHVAAGVLPLAHGSDGGGSIRIPASCCGLFGLKPSRGRVSAAPAPDGALPLGQNGPIAWTVRDAAAFLDAVAGYEPGGRDVSRPSGAAVRRRGRRPAGPAANRGDGRPAARLSRRAGVRGRRARGGEPPRGPGPRRRGGGPAVARRGPARALRLPVADGPGDEKGPARSARAAEPRARRGRPRDFGRRVPRRDPEAAALRAARGGVLGRRGRRAHADTREAARSGRVGARAGARGSSTGARRSSRRSRPSRT